MLYNYKVKMSSAALHHPQNPFKRKKWVGATKGLQSTKRKKSKGSRSQSWLLGDDSYITRFSLFFWLMNSYSQQKKNVMICKKLQEDMTNFGMILKKLQEDMTNLGTLVAEKDAASHYRFDGPIRNLQISGDGSNNMTVNTGQQPQPVKHPDRTSNPVPRPLAMHWEAAPPLTLFGRPATTMQPLPPKLQPVHGETKSSCTEPRARCETEEAYSQGTSLLHYVDGVLGGYADDIGTSWFENLNMDMAECKDSDLYMDEDSDFYSDEDYDQGYEYGDGRCNDDCDPDSCSYGCDLEDVYDIDDGGTVSGLDVVTDSMHRAFQSFDDSVCNSTNTEESDASFAEDPDVVSDEAEAGTSQDPDASYTDMPQNPDIETGVAFANTSQDHETEAEVSFCDTSQGRNVEADMSKADTSQDHDTESHKSFADTSQDRDTESPVPFADTSQAHDTESHKSFADTSQDHDIVSPVSFADTSQDHTEPSVLFYDAPEDQTFEGDQDIESHVSASGTCHDQNTKSCVSGNGTLPPRGKCHSQDTVSECIGSNVEKKPIVCLSISKGKISLDKKNSAGMKRSGNESISFTNSNRRPAALIRNRSVSPNLATNMPKSVVAQAIYTPKSAHPSVQERYALLLKSMSKVPILTNSGKLPLSVQVSDEMLFSNQVSGDMSPSAQLNGKKSLSAQSSSEMLPSAQVSGESPSAQVNGESPSAQVNGESASAQVSGESPSAQVSGESPSAQVSGESPSAHVNGEGFSAVLSGGKPPPGQVGSECFAAVLETVGFPAPVQVTAGLPVPVEVVGEMAFAVSE